MKKNIFLLLVYPLAILAAWPILRYVYYFEIGNNSNVLDKFVFARVYLSSPILMLSGVFLFFSYNKTHKLFGLIFFTIGLVWLLVIIKSFLNEAG